MAELVTGEWSPHQLPLAAAVIIGLFAGDLFLPVPATTLCAVAGRIFGTVPGALICWVGLNLAAAIGYAVGFYLGWPAVQKFSSADSIQSVQDQIQRYGGWPLVALRPVPVLAEASILLLGIYRYPFRKFFPIVAMANFVVAVIFVAMGSWFEAKGQFWLGIIVSSALPVVLLAIWLTWDKRRQPTDSV